MQESTGLKISIVNAILGDKGEEKLSQGGLSRDKPVEFYAIVGCRFY